MIPRISPIFPNQLRAYFRMQQAAIIMCAEAVDHLTSVVAPVLERLADDPNPSLDSANLLELMAEVQKYKALKERAARMEKAVTDAEANQVRPGLDQYKALLGLPLDPEPMPKFWKDHESEQGLARFALTLLLLARLKISPAKFAAKGKRLLTTNPDTIFLAILDDQGKGDFSRN